MGSKILPSILFIFIFFIEGALFALIPYSSSLITNVFFQNYTLAQYGLLFLPLAIGGLLSSLWVGSYAEKHGLHKPFIIGILLNVVALFFVGTILLSVTYTFLNLIFFALTILFLGAGMGIIHTVVSVLIAYHFPKKTEVAITAFYVAVGLGAIGGSFVFHLGNVSLYLILFLLSLFSLFFLFDLYMEYPPIIEPEKQKAPIRGLWTVLLAVFCWGIYEQLVYDWTVLYLVDVKKYAPDKAEWIHRIFLTFFTLSRAFFALVLLKVSLRMIYYVVPLLLLIFTLFVNFSSAETNILFLLSGIGFLYSSLLPIIISFGIKTYPERRIKATSRIIGSVILGLGLGSFTYGQLHSLGWAPLHHLFLIASFFAALVLIFNIFSLRSLKERG
jgi:MFS family permease